MDLTQEMLDIQAAMRKDPVAMLEAMLGEKYCEYQKLIIREVFFGKKKRTAVLAANGMGKSFIAARVMFARMVAYTNHRGLVVGPKEDTVKNVFFMTEFAPLIAKDIAHFNFFRTGEKNIDGKGNDGAKLETMAFKVTNTWWIEGIVASTKEAMSGRHSTGGITAIIEEGSGVPDWAFGETRRWMTGANVKLMTVSNAQRNAGWLYHAFGKKKSQWNLIRITAHDSPNVTMEPGIPESVRENFPDQEWIDEYYDDALKTGNMDDYNTAVEAMFPASGESSVINREKLEAAMARWYPDDHPAVLHGFIRFSWDVAGPGQDKTCVSIIEGPRSYCDEAYGATGDIELLQNIIIDHTRKQYERLKKIHAEHGSVLKEEDIEVRIDQVGLGEGVPSNVRKAFIRCGEKFRVVGYKASARPHRKNAKKYNRKRSEAWFRFAELLYSDQLAMRPDDMMAEEMLSATYEYDEDGRRVVMSKKKMKKAESGGGIGRSPDRADATIQGYAPLNVYEAAIYR